MTEGTMIKTQLDTLRKAMQKTQQQLIALERQQQTLAQQKEQAIQVLLHQQGAIQSAEEMLKTLEDAATAAMPESPLPLDGVAVS